MRLVKADLSEIGFLHGTHCELEFWERFFDYFFQLELDYKYEPD